MIGRFATTCALGALVFCLACGGKEAPKAGAAGKTPAPPAATPAPAPAASAQPAPAPSAAAPAATAATAPAAPEGDAPALDKDKLAKCYQEVYCAQKKGEMDKILPIYKNHGFNTPQEFTKTWIEAAKDTDWVTKIAHEVSKKCQ